MGVPWERLDKPTNFPFIAPSFASPHPIGHFCPSGGGANAKALGSKSVNVKQSWIVISRFQHHLQIRLVSGDKQQQEVSVSIKPSEAEVASGLAVLR